MLQRKLGEMREMVAAGGICHDNDVTAHATDRPLATTDQRLTATGPRLATTDQPLATTDQRLTATGPRLAAADRRLAVIERGRRAPAPAPARGRLRPASHTSVFARRGIRTTPCPAHGRLRTRGDTRRDRRGIRMPPRRGRTADAWSHPSPRATVSAGEGAVAEDGARDGTEDIAGHGAEDGARGQAGGG
ncbi:hypothetical protein [Nonomuraea sp. NPDC049309]|uniref:hypothetical protein n=1 Tax=Nonomuraea sp. NPDC049309 TaxID=3364350 RepID=UPI00371A237A